MVVHVLHNGGLLFIITKHLHFLRNSQAQESDLKFSNNKLIIQLTFSQQNCMENNMIFRKVCKLVFSYMKVGHTLY